MRRLIRAIIGRPSIPSSEPIVLKSVQVQRSQQWLGHPFVLVPARDLRHVSEKTRELRSLGIDFLVVCGERSNDPAVRYRTSVGKWDAINHGSKFISSDSQVVILNDVDTQIHDLRLAFKHLNEADLIVCKVRVGSGPQKKFYRILDPIRRHFPIAASGELMIMRREVLNRVMPIPPCTAEDSYIMFRAIELGFRVKFVDETFVTTERTTDSAQEQAYKIRTTLGIYQAMRLTHPPPQTRAFYLLLPVMALILAIGGPDGRAWAVGVERATVLHLLKRYEESF